MKAIHLYSLIFRGWLFSLLIFPLLFLLVAKVDGALGIYALIVLAVIGLVGSLPAFAMLLMLSTQIEWLALSPFTRFLAWLLFVELVVGTCAFCLSYALDLGDPQVRSLMGCALISSAIGAGVFWPSRKME